ncbi:MAG: hypothetical protein C4533_03395 [Candidatus Omnitrophota bacterium]|jgi:predicted amino acid dehydrogenase|nr:MAG: hypothetical protein C4533_03395 [Candidatus Omnitrophota bacterium]
MRSFAFIIHPRTIKYLKKGWFWDLFNPALKKTPIYKILKPKRIIFGSQDILSYLVIPSTPPKDLLLQGEALILNSILSDEDISKNLDIEMIGLERYNLVESTSAVTLLKKVRMPMTTGNTLLAWSIVESVYRTVKSRGIDLAKMKFSVVGAGTAVGKLFTKKIIDFTSDITLNDTEIESVIRLKTELASQYGGLTVNIEDNLSELTSASDVIVAIGNAPLSTIINLDIPKPGCIIFDASAPFCMVNNKKLRNDITIIRTGLIKLPFEADIFINKCLPRNVVNAPFAETLLLAKESRFNNYSLGDNINPDNLEEIANIAAKYGFETWLPEAPVI